MLRIGINGIGRIGRSILRINQEKKSFKIVAINDTNPDIKNIVYLINYDSLYGQLEKKFEHSKDFIIGPDEQIKYFNKSNIDEVDWKSLDVDIVIDSSGIRSNLLKAKKTIELNNLKNIIITHSPDEVDFTMVLGANEDKLNLAQHKVISSSICDATAIGPILRTIQNHLGIDSGQLTTMHPWLSYQNLMDGPASSWNVPGEIYHHYALGRSSVGNMIPKPTSALDATSRVVDKVDRENFGSYSMRVPTNIVGSADVTILLKSETTKEEILRAFQEEEKFQKWDIIKNNLEPLISCDFKKSSYSVIVDHRFTSLIKGKMLKLLLWYDNEWGYSSRVVDQVSYISEILKEKKPLNQSKIFPNIDGKENVVRPS